MNQARLSLTLTSHLRRALYRGGAIVFVMAFCGTRSISQSAGSSVPTLRATSQLVQANCFATRGKTRIVQELTSADQVRVFEDDKLQSLIALRKAEDVPLTMMVLLDFSGSMSANWDTIQKETARFVGKAMRPGDRFGLLTFNKTIRILTELTEPIVSPESFATKIERAGRDDGVEVYRREGIQGGSRLWDAMEVSNTILKTVPGRKALLVFTDGVDIGSIASTEKIIRDMEKMSMATYGIESFANSGGGVSTDSPELKGPRTFRLIVEQSGGLLFHADQQKQLESELDEVAEILRSQFLIEYRPPHNRRLSFHRIRVEALDPHLDVHCKEGVWH